jgi:hemin uptake protein HemP
VAERASELSDFGLVGPALLRHNLNKFSLNLIAGKLLSSGPNRIRSKFVRYAPAAGDVTMAGDQPEKDSQQPDAAQPAIPDSSEVVIPSDRLFGECREVWIEHGGERYRLRITRRNKLILQK